MKSKDYITLEKCEHQYFYKLEARNFNWGIYDKTCRGFVSIREKSGQHYLFLELHWDADKEFGTAKPIRKLEKCPINLENWVEKAYEENELFKWLKQKQSEFL